MWWHTVTHGRGKGKLANGVGSQYPSHYLGTWCITTADAHNSAASIRLNWRPRRFKWTRPFSRKTKSGFCACAIAFQLGCTNNVRLQGGGNNLLGGCDLKLIEIPSSCQSCRIVNSLLTSIISCLISFTLLRELVHKPYVLITLFNLLVFADDTNWH